MRIFILQQKTMKRYFFGSMVLVQSAFLGMSINNPVLASQRNEHQVLQQCHKQDFFPLSKKQMSDFSSTKWSTEKGVKSETPSLEKLFALKATDVGDCTVEQHRALQDKIDGLKKDTINKSCSEKKNPAITRPEAMANAKIFEDLAAARDAINKICYKGGNAGHKQAADDARRAAATCRAIK
jgi:Novel toxin 16